MSEKQITEQIIKDTLETWCNNVVKVGKVFTDGGDVTAAANDILSNNYDYDNGKVLFKPTLAFGDQTFRPTKEGALAYFVGGNSSFPNDKGFLLKPYLKSWFTDLAYIIHDQLAIVQCNVHFIGADNNQFYVNKSFVFKLSEDGKVKIILHHSSLPYTP